MVALAVEKKGNQFSLIRLILFALLVGAVGRILLTSHATERHGTDAEKIRQCVEQGGAQQVWQQNDDPSVRVFCVEVEDDGCSWWGIMIAQVWPSIVQGCDLRERTSFKPVDGSLDKVEKYLERFARRIK